GGRHASRPPSRRPNGRFPDSLLEAPRRRLPTWRSVVCVEPPSGGGNALLQPSGEIRAVARHGPRVPLTAAAMADARGATIRSHLSPRRHRPAAATPTAPLVSPPSRRSRAPVRDLHGA